MSKDTFISELIKLAESTQISFMADYQPKLILSEVCGFLNSDGGWVIIGHTGKKLLGLESADSKAEEIKSQIAEKIVPQPLVYVQEEQYQKKNLILITVLKGTRQPYSFEGRNYIRKGLKSEIANPDEISVMLRKPSEFASTWEKLTAIDASMDDLHLAEIRKTIDDAEILGRGKSLPKDPEEFLNYFQLFNNSSVKNGALLVFGQDPIRFLSQCRIRLTVMPFGKTGSRYDDSLIIEENLFKAYEQIRKYFIQQLPMLSDFNEKNWDRSDHERYPLEALDEAIVNAMVHRDYNDTSGEVSINIYRDRIEITNSGEIPAGILKSRSSFEMYHAVFRNPMIAHMFFLRGKMEKKGRGLLLIKNRCVEYGLQAPEWVSQNGYTSLTLFGIPKPLNDRMVEFIRPLRTGDKFAREDYENHFKDKISEKTARNDISDLVSGGWVKKSGQGPSTKYTRTNKELPENAG